MELCCTNSSSVLWWTTRAPSGGPPLAPVSGNGRCLSPSVFALLPLHLGTLVTTNWRWFLSPFLYRPRQISEKFNSELADVGNPLVTQLGRYLLWPGVDPGPLKQVGRNRLLVLATCKRRPCRCIESFPTGTFRLPCQVFFRVFSSVVRRMPECNKQRRGTARTVPK